MQNTANLGLKKPEGTDVVNIDDLNYNADKIDVEIKSLKDNKVDKVTGKGLSANDYTTTEKNKLAGIASGANNYTHPSTHPATIITQDATHRMVSDTEKAAWNGKANASHTHTKSQITDIPTALSGFTKDINFDERYYTETEVNNKLSSMYKAASVTFTTRGTSQTFTDAFCTATSLVTVVITGTVEPQGVWRVESQAGKFVITSDAAETANISFDYYIQKAVG